MTIKLRHLLAGALLVLPLALQGFTGLQTVSAADTPDTAKTTVELTKLVFPQDSKVEFANDGKQADFQGGQPVDGVEFTAYNITDGLAKAIKDAKPAEGTTKEEQAVKDIQDTTAKSGDGSAYGAEVGVETTKDGGIADFTLPNYIDGKYQTYLILETKYADPEANTDNTIVQRSTPLILTMPLNTENSGDKAYVYPKNYDEKTVTKDLTDAQQPSHNLGDKVGYTITAPIPFDIATRDQFDVYDTPDKGLDDLKDSLKIKANGTDVPVDAYTVSDVDATDTTGLGFKLTFDPAKLSEYAGQTLTITYDAQVTAATVNKLDNTVTVDFGHNPHTETSKTPVEVGGAKFVKQDATDSKKTLADAVFVLENQDGKIVTITKDEATGHDVYKYIDARALDYQKLNAAVEAKTGDDKKAAAIAELKAQLGDDAENAVVAISDANGAFEFTGLKYADYQTQEIAAPKGYAIATKTTSFTVNKDSYTTQLPITNTSKGILPHTGGMGIYLVIALGLLVMAGGFMVLKKGSRHEEV